MKPECVTNGDITSTDIMLLMGVIAFVRTLPDGLSCHDVCAAVVKEFPDAFEHHRGKFHNGWNHSWLVVRGHITTIIDPYPWACGCGPIMVTTEAMSPWRYLYDGAKVK